MKKHLYLHIFESFLCMVVLIAVLLLGGVGVTYAATSNYSNVLDDLRKDESFDFNDYPNVNDDYSLHVIQIAESTDGELFLYVYQPSALVKPLTATEINMSLSESVDDTALFNLTLLNREGVLQKYRVDGARVSAAKEHYYNITAIYRDYDDSIDTGSSDESIITGKAFSVGKQFKVVIEDGGVSYFCKDTETIEIVNPYFDYLEYSNGFKWYKSSCHSHYVAFSTDKQIDTLLEATVRYCSQSYEKGGSGSVSYGKKVERVVDLTGTQKGSSSADGWFAKVYEWERIQDIDEFISTESLSSDTLSNLRSKQWVLRFCETDYSKKTLTGVPGGITVVNKTIVTDVAILRLKFESEGQTFNLGAVCDIGQADNVAGNTNTNELAGLFEWLFRVTLNFFKSVGDWIADFLHIPNWLGNVIFGVGIVIAVLFVISVIVSLIRKIRGDK